MKSWAIAILLSLSGAAADAAQQDAGWVELRFHRVYLRNGNFIDGQLVRQTAKEVVLRLAAGEMAIRQDLVERVEYVKMRSVNEKPAEVTQPKTSPKAREPGAVTGPARRDPLTRPDPKTPRAVPARDFIAGRKPEELYQPSEAVRAQVRAVLEEFHHADDEMRGVSASKLQKIEGDMAPYLASLLETFDRDQLGYITAAITVTKDKRAVPVLAKQLDSANPLVRMHAANTLGTLGELQAAEPLRGVLKDKDPNVRGAAISALQALGGVDAFQDLVLLLADSEREIRTRAISALADLAKKHEREEDLERALIDAAERATGVARTDLVGSLGRSLRKESWNLLAPFLSDDNVQVRSTAATAMGALGSAASSDAVIRQLTQEKERMVRVALATAAAKVRATGAVEPLIGWLSDPAEDVQNASRQALSALTGQNFGNDQEKWAAWWAQNRK